MHLVENSLKLTFDLYSGVGSDGFELIYKLVEGLLRLRQIDNHHHIEKILDNGLWNVKDVDAVVGQVSTYFGDDSDGVLSHHGDDGTLVVHIFIQVSEVKMGAEFI